jgi:hypothetical protein
MADTTIQPTIATDRPPVFKLLNEILYIIFSSFHSLDDYSDFVAYTGTDSIQYYAPVQTVLRSVCRRFRFIVNELAFWFEEAFDFRNLCVQFIDGPQLEGRFMRVLSTTTTLFSPLGVKANGHLVHWMVSPLF